jgi:excisionase family DNA binding protein
MVASVVHVPAINAGLLPGHSLATWLLPLPRPAPSHPPGPPAQADVPRALDRLHERPEMSTQTCRVRKAATALRVGPGNSSSRSALSQARIQGVGLQTPPAGRAGRAPKRASTIEDLDGRTTITVEEAAALLGIGRSAAYEAARRGQLPTRRLGRRLFVPVPALLEWLGATARPHQPTPLPARRGTTT